MTRAIVLEELVCGYHYLMRASALLRCRREKTGTLDVAKEARELFLCFFKLDGFFWCGALASD
jgi:hypothetical protein